MWRIMLPLCRACNGELDRLFEKPAKVPVRRLLDQTLPVTSAADVLAVARWVGKTFALAAHPASNHTAYASRREPEKKNVNGPWSPYPVTVLEAIRRGDLPDDSSLWVAVLCEGGIADPDFDRVLLRHTYRRDGLGGTGWSRTSGYNIADTRCVAMFQFVHHPLHDFIHPFEPGGLVTRLWPNPPARLDLSSMPVLALDTRLSSVFASSGFSHGLAPGKRSSGEGLPRF
ncbi:hypothetical protein ACFZC5_35645 [Nocardia gamkensis]|uniref:hypothetical protein n=1 Tax=Nocardia gamkensis TaxID=352869 RepID=UPI0036E217DA